MPCQRANADRAQPKARDLKLRIGYHTAKRAYWSTDDFVKDLSSRIADRVQVTTDSYRPYQSVIRRHFQGKADYATMQKIYATPLNTGSDAWRRYGPP